MIRESLSLCACVCIVYIYKQIKVSSFDMPACRSYSQFSKHFVRLHIRSHSNVSLVQPSHLALHALTTIFLQFVCRPVCSGLTTRVSAKKELSDRRFHLKIVKSRVYYYIGWTLPKSNKSGKGKYKARILSSMHLEVSEVQSLFLSRG